MHEFIKRVLIAMGLATSFQVIAADWQALPETVPSPADNPTTTAKVELGHMLYMDPRISSTGTVSCNSCHNIMIGGDDNRPVSMGVHGKTGGRSAPTVWNAAFSSIQFWDGRAASLEEQAKGPVVNPVEMGMKNLHAEVQVLKDIPGYLPLFKDAFGGDDPITRENVARAIAAFERTLITPNSPYDRYVKGDKSALTEQQVRGMKAFDSVGCTSCHSGAAFNGPALMPGGFLVKFPTFTDNDLVTKYGLTKDAGRFTATGQDSDKHLWKVPTLRNIAMTAPYFHNGAVKSLPEAVRVMAKVQLNRDLSQQQVDDITGFLNSLTGEFPKLEQPRLPPSINLSAIKQP